MSETTWREIIVVPRWGRFPAFLKDICFIRPVKLTIDVEKGWLWETVRFEIQGDGREVDAIRHLVKDAVDDYNKRVSRK